MAYDQYNISFVQASVTFYPFFPTRLIDSIKHKHSCKILYLTVHNILILIAQSYTSMPHIKVNADVDWLQFLKQFFINVSYHILVASLTLMALFKTEPSELDWLQINDMTH